MAGNKEKKYTSFAEMDAAKKGVTNVTAGRGLATLLNEAGPVEAGPYPAYRGPYRPGMEPRQPAQGGFDMNALLQMYQQNQAAQLDFQREQLAASLQPKSKIVRKDISGNVIQGPQPRGLDAYYANNPHLERSPEQRREAFNRGMGSANKNLHI